MKIEPQILERLKRQREEGLADMKRHGRNAWWCFIVAVVLAPLPSWSA